MAHVTFSRKDLMEFFDSLGKLKGKKLNNQIEKIQRIMENDEEVSSKIILKNIKSKKENGLTKPHNAWQLFLKEERPKLEKGMNGRQQVQEISKIWQAMTDDEKKPYQDKAKEESERYKEEKAQLSEESSEKSENDEDGDIINIDDDDIDDRQYDKSNSKPKTKTKKSSKEKYE